MARDADGENAASLRALDGKPSRRPIGLLRDRLVAALAGRFRHVGTAGSAEPAAERPQAAELQPIDLPQPAEPPAIDLPSEWRRDLLPEDVLLPIRRLGYHPFIVLRCGESDPAAVYVCKDQNEVENFLADLSKLAERSAFVRGLCHAIKADPYEAAYAFFDWVKKPEDLVTVYIFDAPEQPFPGYYDYPIFAKDEKSDPAGGAERIDGLAAMFGAYERAKGNDRTRFAILEALAFALSRSLGALGQYERAADFVRRGLDVQPDSFYLPICLQTLEQKIRGLATPKRLEKFAGEDLHALDHVFCPFPFTRMEILPAGNVHCCCPDLVPTIIGNIENESASAAMESEQARKIRASILDGSYRYCNPVRCQQMIRDQIPRKTDPAIVNDPVLGRVLREHDASLSEIRELALGYDPTCNLSCPSCRREMIVDKQKQSHHRSQQVKENIRPLLPKLRLLYINNGGEFLFSRPSREVLQSIDSKLCPDLTIDLISNGTLFSESEWQKFANIHGRVRNIRISTDAATKETFESVRRGGKWERFVDNLRFIGELRRHGEIRYFLLAFTYQLANFREMPAFVGFGKDVGADAVSFEPLLPSQSMTPAEYATRAVHLFTNPLRAEFLQILENPALSESWVMADWKEKSN
jgi:hypothetical protein